MVRSGRSAGEVAGALGCSPQSVTNWVRRFERDQGIRKDGLTTEEREELKRLRRENLRLKQERDLLKRAAVNSMRERNSVRVGNVLKGSGCEEGVGSIRWRSGGSFGIGGRLVSRRARSRGLWIAHRARSTPSWSGMVVLPREFVAAG